MTLYAHSVPGTDSAQWETLTNHLQAVAAAAGRNAHAFGSEKVAESAGWLHDLGKVKPGFQSKLHGENNDTSHSGEGARYAQENLGPIGKLIAFCIAGHHSGLPNGLNRSEGRPVRPLTDRIRLSENVALPDEVKHALPCLTCPKPLEGLSGKPQFELQFFIRMLFSALVDADFIETERFYSPDKPRGDFTSLAPLQSALSKHLASFPPPTSEVNVLRAEVLEAAEESATLCPGLFSLTAPTGGGKTLSSLQFALKHAEQHGLRRVIYVIPYTSIIEQTADVFRTALQDHDAILEHHSSFNLSEEVLDETQAERMQLAAQNWDRPVIVTTAVQFFESLFGNRTQKCRKLHNIAQSVIVLDEAQTLPVVYLRPCLAAMQELTRGYGCSVVLCTATQPAIRDMDGLQAPEALPANATREIAPDPHELYQRLKRVEARFEGLLSNQDLAAQIKEQSALVIVNNKRQARAIFDLLGSESALHLSTNMTPRHRRDVLVRIKDGFDGPVVSTALVEAGVDLDFPQVWRAVAGLDSIVQAAGRCNREGKLGRLGQMFVFEPEGGFPPPPELEKNAGIARDILRVHADDPLHPDAVRAYFKHLYWDRAVDLDSQKIIEQIERCGNQFDFPFADIAADFKLIQETTRPLIICSQAGRYGLNAEAEQFLKYGNSAGAIARKMQSFTVSVSTNVQNELIRLGAAYVVRPDEFGDQFVMLENARLYDDDAGFLAEDAEDLGVMIS